MHLKDFKTVNGEKIPKIAGEGDLKVTEVLKALKAINYQYCLAIEYEESEKNPMSDIEACLKHVRECALKVT